MNPTGTVIATVLGDIADLVSALVWPVLVGILLWVLREPIQALARRISASAQRVEIGAQGLAVDLGSAVAPVPSQATTALAGVRLPEPAGYVVDSAAMAMFDQLQTEAPAPYLAVDLGEGRQWLTSRLFIFAILLQVMRKTRTLVFIETVSGVRGRFLCLAATEHVRWALARAYPWLEADYANAYAGATLPSQTGQGDPEPLVVDEGGRLRQDVAHQLATNFVFAVQAPAQPAAATSPDEWVSEDRPQGMFTEHASWLTGAELERVLGTRLRRFASVQNDTYRPPADIARDALRIHGEDAVVLVDNQHRFMDLVVDRRDALECLARNWTDDKSEAGISAADRG